MFKRGRLATLRMVATSCLISSAVLFGMFEMVESTSVIKFSVVDLGVEV